MPRIPIFKLGASPDKPAPPKLASYTPALSMEGLQLGVDNLRHDVHLSSKFVEQARLQVARLIARHGNVEGLLAAEAPESSRGNHFIGSAPTAPRARAKAEASELKPLLTDLHVAALNQAKAQNNLSLDQLARLAIIKFLRVELNAQFAQMLERCRVMLKSYEGLRQQKAMEYREQVGAFQVAKKIILRKTGQELFRTLREIEKETLGRTRRSLFGDANEANYQLFLNPLIFSEDGRDTYLNAEHYVMLGNFDRDPDRFDNVRRVACEFLQALDLGPSIQDDKALDGWLNVPENAQELVGGGSPDVTTPAGQAQEARLQVWVETLEAEEIMNCVVASYEVVPLLSEYSPRIHAQQLKNALISREERARLEKLIEEHGKLSPGSFYAAMSRMSSCRGAERARVAGRFLRDFLRYHRDLRRVEILNGVMDTINLIGNEKLRELSAMNGTLYEFLLADDAKRAVEDKVVHHVVIKADVRDSSRLTRSLMERGLNPASYFSLNFYDPVNKLLSKYGATKVFLEGDAIILALLEREGESALAVSKACVLAREMIEIVRGYNQLLTKSGLPSLELGIGISYQNSAPLYLMDGEQRIMISDALNESDRLSSCNKRVRKPLEKLNSPFNVYSFQIVSDADAGENTEDFILNYNLAGIRMNPAAFAKLQKEISLEACTQHQLPELWGSEKFRLYRGLVPLGNGIFRSIIIRESRAAQVEARAFSLQKWTERTFYEVCSNPSVYEALEGKKAAAGK